MKRLISFIICMLMLLSLVPATAFAEDAASEDDAAYDLPEAGDSVNILGTGKAEEARRKKVQSAECKVQS